MLKRLKSGRSSQSVDIDHNDGSVVNQNSTAKSKKEQAQKSTKSKDGARKDTKSPKVTPSTKSSRKIPSVEDQLRDSLQRNQRMEETIRSIAQKANIIETDTQNMDITEISSKLMDFVSGSSILPEPVDPEEANSLLIEEVFDEIDEHDRKYEELQREDDGQFEDDIPPKKVCIKSWEPL